MERHNIDNPNKIKSFFIKQNFEDIDFNIPFSHPYINPRKSINISKSVTFINCSFNKNFELLGYSSKTTNLTFIKCSFHKNNTLLAKDAILSGKIRFRNCDFFGKVDFRNTRFLNLADFWKCTFYQKVIFYKTDFLDTVVFSSAVFKENVLFTYTLINKLIILRGTKIEKGIDLSLTIISGELSIFDFNLKNFKTFSLKNKTTSEEILYEETVSSIGKIPIKNKRETFRIIKTHHEKQNNFVESLPYKFLEKEALREELLTKKGFLNSIDKIILNLNKYSNKFGTSVFRSFLFIIIVGAILFYSSILHTDLFHFSLSLTQDDFKEGIKYFIQFLIPTHKMNYLGEVNQTVGFYLFDFIGRIFVSYGIYQFIQAFRKFK